MEQILVMPTVDDYPLEVELQGFFWLNDYGWCFAFGETEDDGGAYGVMDLDFVETRTNYETKILEYLEQQPKEEIRADIPICDFFEWMKTQQA